MTRCQPPWAYFDFDSGIVLCLLFTLAAKAGAERSPCSPRCCMTHFCRNTTATNGSPTARESLFFPLRLVPW